MPLFRRIFSAVGMSLRCQRINVPSGSSSSVALPSANRPRLNRLLFPIDSCRCEEVLVTLSRSVARLNAFLILHLSFPSPCPVTRFELTNELLPKTFPH